MGVSATPFYFAYILEMRLDIYLKTEIRYLSLKKNRKKYLPKRHCMNTFDWQSASESHISVISGFMMALFITKDGFWSGEMLAVVKPCWGLFYWTTSSLADSTNNGFAESTAVFADSICIEMINLFVLASFVFSFGPCFLLRWSWILCWDLLVLSRPHGWHL